MQSVCFPLYIAADDRVRLLTKPEKADFAFHFCPLAAMNRRQPGVIPSMPVPMLAKKLGLDKKVVLKRLVRLSSPGIELIDIEYDAPGENGELSLLSSVRVEIVDFCDWNGLDEGEDRDLGYSSSHYSASEAVPPFPSGGNGTVTRSTGAERQARHRARKSQGRQSTDNQTTDSQNRNSNAFEQNSNALTLQNGQNSVTSAESVMPQTSESNASGALRPSRAGDDNVQRYGLDLNSKNLNTDSETLNVTNVGNAGPVTPQSVTPTSKAPPPNLRARSLASQAVALSQELRDLGSESRHYQLVAICEEHNLPDLVTQALNETRRRMNNPRRGQVEKPGAYYQSALLRKLAEHNVHVPTRAQLEAEPASEVQRLIQESLAASLPPSYTPLDETYQDVSDFPESAYREDQE